MNRICSHPPFPYEARANITIKYELKNTRKIYIFIKINKFKSNKTNLDKTMFKARPNCTRTIVILINCNLFHISQHCKGELLQQLEQSNTVSMVIDLLNALMPSIGETYQSLSPLGSTLRAQRALQELRTQTKTIETTDQLMVRMIRDSWKNICKCEA